VWVSRVGRTGPQLSNPAIPLFEFAFPSELCPAKPGPRAAARGQLSWTSVPFSTCRIRRSTDRGRSKPATFRVQGLATLCAVFARRIRAGFISRRQRSWDSPFGAFFLRRGDRCVSARSRPPAVFPVSKRPARMRGAGPTGRGSWVLSRAGVPDDRQVISPPTAGGSLGLFPSKVFQPPP
jgi:hypothetical protein